MLTGSIVALVTPMHENGEVAWDSLDELIEWHVVSGTHGIVPMGTTGESATLDTQEHLQVIKRTIDRVAGRVPVIAGTGSNSTAEAIHQTQEAEAAGADLNDSVKMNISMTDLSTFDTVNQVMTTFLEQPFPARACVEVAALPKGVKIKVEAIVWVKP